MPKKYKKKGPGRPKKDKNEGKPKRGNYVIRYDGKCDTGRPTGYKEEYCELCYRLCLLGKTDKEIIDILGVEERTFYRWKENYPEFRQSFFEGRENADANVAKSLYQRATGIAYKEKKVVQKPEGTEITVTEKYVPPDTKACETWMYMKTLNQHNRWIRTQAEQAKLPEKQNGIDSELIKDDTSEEQAATIYQDIIKQTRGEQK